MKVERRLVRELMKVGVKTCPLDTPVTDIARWMLEECEEAIVVLNQSGDAAGYVSQEEIVVGYTNDDAFNLRAEDIMNTPLPVIPPDIPLNAAALLMRDQGVRCMFLTHRAEGAHYPAAILTYKHLLRHYCAEDESELKDLGAGATRQEPLKQFIERRDEARKSNRS